MSVQAAADKTPAPDKQRGGSERGSGELQEERRRGRMGYWLILPGFVFLLLFFVLPVFSLLATSLYRRRRERTSASLGRPWNSTTTCGCWAGYWPSCCVPSASPCRRRPRRCDRLSDGLPACVRLAIMPCCAAILLVLIIAPFFTSFILRTQAWKQILADEGPVVSVLRTCIAARRRTAHRHRLRRGLRPDLQLPAVHGAAALREHRQDRPPLDRGRQRPVRQRPSSASSR